jgi:hypothetical protein
MLPSVAVKGENHIDVAKSGLYSGCWRTLNAILSVVSTVQAASSLKASVIMAWMDNF